MQPSSAHQEARDEVDRIAKQWRAVAPHLDANALHVFSRITRISHRLAAIRRHAFAEHGLDTWEFDVLSALRRSGPPFHMTPGALLADTLVTSGTMTSRVEKLHARGLVTRIRDTEDRRSVTIELTDAGLELVDGAIASLVLAERTLLNQLSEQDTNALTASLRTLLSSMEPPLE